MKVGVFTPLLSQLALPAVLDKLRGLRIDTVELGTGNYPGDAHCKLSMLDDPSALAEFRQALADHGASISALSCHGNALHPDPARAKHDAEVSRKTILLAEKLGVQTVVDFSGCPGDSPTAKRSSAPRERACRLARTIAWMPAESQNVVPARSAVIVSGSWRITDSSRSHTSPELLISISAGSTTTTCRPDQLTAASAPVTVPPQADRNPAGRRRPAAGGPSAGRCRPGG